MGPAAHPMLEGCAPSVYIRTGDMVDSVRDARLQARYLRAP